MARRFSHRPRSYEPDGLKIVLYVVFGIFLLPVLLLKWIFTPPKK